MAGYTSLLSLLFILPCCLCQRTLVQNPTNLGREFILAFPDNVNEREVYFKQLILTTPSDIPATVLVKAPLLDFTWEVVVIVTKYNLTRVDLPPQLQATRRGKGKYGVYVVSTEDIVVVGSNTGMRKSEAYLGLPLYRLGLEYYVITNENHPSFVIVGTENNTKVEINYPPIPNSNMRPVPTTIILNEYETYLAENTLIEGDFSGVRINADRTVGVVSGNLLNGRQSSDIIESNDLVEMMVATRFWGKEFVTVDPGFALSGSEYKFIASRDDTEILLGNGQRYKLRRAGQYHSIILRHREYMTVKSNKPIMMVVISRRAPSAQAAATMATIIPKSQYLNNYTIISMEGFINSLSIVIEASKVEGLRLDGQAVRGIQTDVLNSNLVVLALKVDDTGHELIHINRRVNFMVLAAGNGIDTSYAYPAGMRLRNMGPLTNCKMSRSSRGDGVDNDCDGSVDEEEHNFKDDDGDGKIDEDLEKPLPYQHSCHVIKDPHLLTYAGQHASLPIPCGYLLTDVKLRNTFFAPGLPYFDFIAIRILGGNGKNPINGRFYVTDVSVYVAFINGELIVAAGRFTIGEKIIERYGNWTLEIFNGNITERVQLSYDPSEKLATLKIAYATPVVLFRPPVREQGNNQQKPPGLFFTVGGDLIENSLERFPRSLASTLTDTTSFKETADETGIHEKNVGVYGVLKTLQQNVTDENDQDQYCPLVRDQYDNCEGNESAAFNICAPMLFNNNIVGCLADKFQEYPILAGYYSCVRYVCVNQDEACDQLKTFAEECPIIENLVHLPECFGLNRPT